MYSFKLSSSSFLVFFVVTVFCLLRYVIPFDYYIFIWAGLSVVFFVYFFVLLIFLNGIDLKSFFIFIFLLFPIFFSFLKFSDDFSRSLFLSINMMLSYIIAYWLLRRSLDDVYLGVVGAYYIYLFYLFFCILYYGSSHEDFNDFLYESSRNAVSGIAIILYSTILSIRSFQMIKIGYAPVIFLLIISFMAFGRAGIVFSVFLFFLTWIYNNPMFSIRSFLFSFVLLVLFGVFYEDIVGLLLNKTNFSMLFDSPRLLMNLEYLSRLDSMGFLMGVDLSTIPVIYDHGGNPHNSFIYLHSIFGVSIVSIFLIFISAVFFVFSKHRSIASFCLAVMLLRAFFDISFLGGSLDLLFFIVFILLVENRFKCFRDGLSHGKSLRMS